MKAVDNDPTNRKAQLALGNLLLVGHHNAEARERAETIPKGDPGNLDAQTLLAAVGGNLSQAIEEAGTAVQIDPNHSVSYVMLAELEERNKDLAAVEHIY